MPRLKPEELESRRREIVEAARSCFLRNGFHRTTTDDICRQASITPGGLYHYFRGKEEIITAVIQETTDSAIGPMREVIESPTQPGTAFQQLSQFFMEMWQNPELDSAVRLDIEIWAEALKNDKLNDINKQSWAMQRQLIEDMCKRNASDGLYSMPDVDTRGLSSLLLAILVGFRIGKVLWKEDFDLNAAIVTLFLVHTGRLTITMPEIPGLPGDEGGQIVRPARLGVGAKALARGV